MEDKQRCHGPMPPTMLVDSTVVTPGADRPSWPSLGTLRRALTLDELLKVNPFSLRLRQERAACPRGEIADDDTNTGRQFQHR